LSFAAAHDVREQVRQATDIVDLVGSQLQLRRQGRMFVTRCPWHDDTKPSLNVNPERQSWRCWVCNIGGDVFSFVMQREGVNFRDALQILADRAGIKLTQTRQAPVEPGSPEDKATLYQATAWAENQFHDCLLKSSEAEAARQYLADRGISGDSIARFKIGYSPDQWQWLLDRARTTAYSPAVLEACGLAGTSPSSGRPYDRFKGRVIFPIRDLQNRPIAFGGRILPGASQENAAKYVNSPETRLFTKSDNLYALDQARDVVAKQRSIVVVEGYTDVVLSHQCGVRNVVAVLGTALNQRHLRILKRFADTVYLVLDGDEAGQRRTNEVLSLFIAEDLDLRIMTLPDELDPAEFMLERGAPQFEQLLGGAVDALEHKIRVATAEIDLGRDTSRANRALEEILSTVAVAPVSLAGDPSARLLREQQVLSRLAHDFRLTELDLRERLKQLRSQASSAAGQDRWTGPTTARVELEGSPIPARTLPPLEVELLGLLANHAELHAIAFDQLLPQDLSSEPARMLFELLRDAFESGEPWDFTAVLSALENPRHQALLVEIDEGEQLRAPHATVAPAARLQDAVQQLHGRRNERDQRAMVAVLEQRKLGIQQETELLAHLFEQERSRRGLVTPTDGRQPRP